MAEMRSREEEGDTCRFLQSLIICLKPKYIVLFKCEFRVLEPVHVGQVAQICFIGS